MFSTKELPSPSSVFSAYASMAGSLMLVRSMAHDLIPQPIRGYLFSAFRSLFKHHEFSSLTLIIDDSHGMSGNQVFYASGTYLYTKVSPDTKRLKVSKSPKEKNFNIQLDNGEKIVDYYEGVVLKWNFVTEKGDKDESRGPERQFFELIFHQKHKDLVLNSYLPYVLRRAKEIEDEKRVLKMYTLNGLRWEFINLEHPATFETMAMDTDLKNSVIEDLNRFIKRRDFYKRVGRAWKRGYLLYGPPGTGKSSLVAAIANHLKFDVYDLQLANIKRDADLRKLLLATGNRSILVIEDIDCSVDLPNRLRVGDAHKQADMQLTLSGLLNFIDGLWSTCGDERIIIFTTNHKEKLDPALLRPGRMDMHIHMSYCTFQGFKILASNYLDMPRGSHHRLYGEIESMIDDAEVTPAQVAEELMKSEETLVALEDVVKLLKRKKMEADELENDGDVSKVGIQDKKRRKLDNGPKMSIVGCGGRRKSTRRRY